MMELSNIFRDYKIVIKGRFEFEDGIDIDALIRKISNRKYWFDGYFDIDVRLSSFKDGFAIFIADVKMDAGYKFIPDYVSEKHFAGPLDFDIKGCYLPIRRKTSVAIFHPESQKVI